MNIKTTALLALAMIGTAAKAQTPTNFYAAGASYSNGATPAIAGNVMYGHALGSAGTYAFTIVDFLPNTVKPLTVTTNIGVGVAQKVASIGPAAIILPTAAALTVTGSNAGWAWSTGGAALIPVKNNWSIMPMVRVVKSSTSNGTGYQPIFGIDAVFGK